MVLPRGDARNLTSEDRVEDLGKDARWGLDVAVSAANCQDDALVVRAPRPRLVPAPWSQAVLVLAAHHVELRSEPLVRKAPGPVQQPNLLDVVHSSRGQVQPIPFLELAPDSTRHVQRRINGADLRVDPLQPSVRSDVVVRCHVTKDVGVVVAAKDVAHVASVMIARPEVLCLAHIGQVRAQSYLDDGFHKLQARAKTLERWARLVQNVALLLRCLERAAS
mmetsp:Transcript_57822/g.134669  ORF Transcript_57822/g.134669 Transcript_57822/m.134669 type:complete len:221 (-) Transcript_57822:187-849(-)